VLAFTHDYPVILKPLFTVFSFLVNFDALAIGCLCAVILAQKRGILEDFFKSRPLSSFLLACSLILVPHCFNQLLIFKLFTIPLGNTFQAGGFAILLLHSIIRPNFGIFRLLNLKVVSGVGVLSYSIYIWQQLFCTQPSSYGISPTWWLSYPTWLIAAFGTAVVSYFCLERPLFRLRARFRGLT
jgi:peptidoglycan/LPS O-acetylase OafA/YrhL